MSSADISALGALNPVEPLDLSDYADNKGASTLPPKGRYTVRAPENFPAEAFGRTQAGALSVQVDPTIVGPAHEGYILRFTKVSAKPFKRSGKTVSQLGDYLRAFGIVSRFTDEQQQADAAAETANRTYEVEADWSAYNKNTRFRVEGMERFPSDGNGGHLPFYTDPTDFEVDESGQPKLDAEGNKINKRLRANLVVTRFVPATM